MTLLEFIERYPPRPSRRQPANDDEHRLLGAADGVLHIGAPPMSDTTPGHPARAQADDARHLWVFRVAEGIAQVPAVLELVVTTPPLQSGKAKHSNLTGGGSASSGGELWVDPADPTKLYVNGASGRYGPTTPNELEDAVSVFAGLGYKAISFGWDDDGPARFFRG